MKYKTLLKQNPLDKNATPLYYPFPVYSDTLELADLLTEISHASSMTPSDVKGVVESFVELLQRYLVRGNKIKINGIGTFKLSFSGQGKEDPKDLISTDINKVKVSYLADRALKDYVNSSIKFEKIKTITNETENNKDDSIIESDNLAV